MGVRKVHVKDLLADVENYIKTANPPIVAEFAHMHDITRQRLYQLADEEKEKGDKRLFDAIKKISEAKEIKLEKGALNGEYAPNMAIFSLKQLGWRDKVENTDTTAIDKLDEILRETKKNASAQQEAE